MLGFLRNIMGGSDDAIKDAIQQGAFLVDVRSPREFAAGTVENAVNIPLDQLREKLSLFKGKKNIVLFCRSGARSGQAKIILEKEGFSNVFNGGTWQKVDRFVQEKK